MEKLRAHVCGETEEKEKRKRTEWEEKGEGKRTPEKKPQRLSLQRSAAPRSPAEAPRKVGSA